MWAESRANARFLKSVSSVGDVNRSQHTIRGAHDIHHEEYIGVPQEERTPHRGTQHHFYRGSHAGHRQVSLGNSLCTLRVINQS